MKNWNKTKEEIQNDYKLSVQNMALDILSRKHFGIDDQLNDLFDKFEKEGKDVSFVCDVCAYIENVKEGSNPWRDSLCNI